MKKIIALLLALVMVLALVACGAKEAGNSQDNTVQGGSEPEEAPVVESEEEPIKPIEEAEDVPEGEPITKPAEEAEAEPEEEAEEEQTGDESIVPEGDIPMNEDDTDSYDDLNDPDLMGPNDLPIS